MFPIVTAFVTPSDLDWADWGTFLDRRDFGEFYDLGRDPSEQRNLAAAQPERCARLRQRLAAWTDANRRQYDRLGIP